MGLNHSHSIINWRNNHLIYLHIMNGEKGTYRQKYRQTFAQTNSINKVSDP